jgi:hypothetical protein
MSLVFDRRYRAVRTGATSSLPWHALHLRGLLVDGNRSYTMAGESVLLGLLSFHKVRFSHRLLCESLPSPMRQTLRKSITIW